MYDEKRKSKKSLEILDDVFAFSSHYKDSPLELGASLMYTFAANLDHIEFERVTIH